VRRYAVELASKVTLPLMNMIVCLLAFAGSTQLTLRGNLKGLGISLVWGVAYYLLVGLWEGLGKSGVVPVPVAVLAPHLLAVWWCVRVLRRTL
jgi:lipopolysaccharide export LptBFGC system permease protein LptF